MVPFFGTWSFWTSVPGSKTKTSASTPSERAPPRWATIEGGLRLKGEKGGKRGDWFDGCPGGYFERKIAVFQRFLRLLLKLKHPMVAVVVRGW